ncbi:hypothetical protein BDD12DRAFT_890300 [Trichophaea hybrida]|nr:hypothetical protein BDD12DRAFT_890300 [Trichophaea hybrida]
MVDTNYGPDFNENNLFKYLRHGNPLKLIIAFLRKFKGYIGSTFHKGINFARKNDPRGYIKFIGSAEFRKALWGSVKRHKWITFFFSLGILLMCNPLAIAGFTSTGVAAGSLAAAWHSSIGIVATGSLFAGAQSAGVTLSIVIPAVGAVIIGLVIAWVIWKEQARLRRWWKWLTGQDNSDEKAAHNHVE